MAEARKAPRSRLLRWRHPRAQARLAPGSRLQAAVPRSPLRDSLPTRWPDKTPRTGSHVRNRTPQEAMDTSEPVELTRAQQTRAEQTELLPWVEKYRPKEM